MTIYKVYTTMPTYGSLSGQYTITDGWYETLYLRGTDNEREIAAHVAKGGKIAINATKDDYDFKCEFQDHFTKEQTTRYFKMAHITAAPGI